MIGIYKNYLGADVRIETTYTDSEGFFSISMSPESNVYIGVFAGDKNIKVKSQILSIRYRYIYHNNQYDIVTNSTTVVELEPIDMSTDEGQAIQISQAALVSRDYAYEMTEEIPTDVKIFYPSDGNNCNYNCNSISNWINIVKTSEIIGYPNSYAAWDVIMHEYGHHMQYILNNANNPALEHSSSENNADKYRSKDIGVRLAWAEAWPTVFAMMAQDYYKQYLSGIDTVADSSYTSYSGIHYNIETTSIAKGEACERSIMAVLWDIYDTCNDDSIWLGHNNVWGISTISGTFTFSDFIDNFYNTFPQHKDNLGKILEKYAIATTKPVVLNSDELSFDNSMTLYWESQCGSQYYFNNRFSIVLYKNEVSIFRKDNIITNSYSFTVDEWQQILLNANYVCGEFLNLQIVIIAYQYDENSYLTGPYYSEKTNFSILIEHNYEPYNSCYERCRKCGYTIQSQAHDYTHRYESMSNTATHYAYCECGEATVEDHTFATSGALDICSFCKLEKDHIHEYTYISCHDQRTHRKMCLCGVSSIEACFGMSCPVLPHVVLCADKQ